MNNKPSEIHTCIDCERKGIAKIAMYKTIAERDFSFTRTLGTTYLCKECLKLKSYDQIDRAEGIRPDAENPKNFISLTAYKQGTS